MRNKIIYILLFSLFSTSSYSAGIYQGEVIYSSFHRNDSALRRYIGKGSANYLNTESNISLDTKTVGLIGKLAIKPQQVGKEIKEDITVISNTANLVAKAGLGVIENGILGTAEVLRQGLASGGASVDITKEENKTQNFSKAQTADKFEKAADKAGAHFQSKMGVKAKSKVRLYQGEDEKLRDTEHSKYNASFDSNRNTINYNTSRKGFNTIETVVENLAHESSHKTISENNFLKVHINSKQEEGVARLVGQHARDMAKGIKDKDNTKPILNSEKWNERNKGAVLFKKNNEKLAGVDGKKVKASPGLLSDGSPYSYIPGNNPLVEYEQQKAAQDIRLSKLAKGETPLEYHLPFVGPIWQGIDNIEQGNVGKGALYIGLGAVEALPFPLITSAIGKGAKAGSKADRLLGIGKASVRGGKRVVKGFTEHSIDRAITRGFKTSEILKIIKQGNKVQCIGRYGVQTRYTLGSNMIIVNSKGKIITMFSNLPGTTKGLGKGNFMPFK